MIDILRDTGIFSDESSFLSPQIIGSKPLLLGARKEQDRSLQLCREIVLLVNSLKEKAAEHAR